MSLILEALRKLERDKDAPERGFVVMTHVPWARSRGGSRLVAIGALALAVAAGALAMALWREVGERLGEALALFIDVLNPERIVIGSIYERCARFIAPSMHAVIAREALPDSTRDCAIVPAHLGEEIGSYAAVAVARYRTGL